MTSIDVNGAYLACWSVFQVFPQPVEVKGQVNMHVTFDLYWLRKDLKNASAG